MAAPARSHIHLLAPNDHLFVSTSSARGKGSVGTALPAHGKQLRHALRARCRRRDGGEGTAAEVAVERRDDHGLAGVGEGVRGVGEVREELPFVDADDARGGNLRARSEKGWGRVRRRGRGHEGREERGRDGTKALLVVGNSFCGGGITGVFRVIDQNDAAAGTFVAVETTKELSRLATEHWPPDQLDVTRGSGESTGRKALDCAEAHGWEH